MSNHFHVLLEVPDPEKTQELTSDELLELLPILYSKNSMLHVKPKLDRAKENLELKREI
ncbi:MAG: hypothetical protein ACKVJU_23975 [Verrucomicrobiales bacterium]